MPPAFRLEGLIGAAKKRAGWLALPLLAALALLLLSGAGESGMTAEEKRVAQTLACVAGAGEVRVTLYYSEGGSAFGSDKTLAGALVVAAGAGDVAVRLGLTQAVETLLALPPGSVMVLRMEDAK